MICFFTAVFLAGVFAYATFWRGIWQEFHNDLLLNGDDTRYRFFSVKGRIAYMNWWQGTGTFPVAAKRKNNNSIRWLMSGVGALGIFVATSSLCGSR